IVSAAASLPPLQLPRASESPVTFHCIGRCLSSSFGSYHARLNHRYLSIVSAAASLPPFQLSRASESSVTFHCIGRCLPSSFAVTTRVWIAGNFPLHRQMPIFLLPRYHPPLSH